MVGSVWLLGVGFDLQTMKSNVVHGVGIDRSLGLTFWFSLAFAVVLALEEVIISSM